MTFKELASKHSLTKKELRIKLSISYPTLSKMLLESGAVKSRKQQPNRKQMGRLKRFQTIKFLLHFGYITDEGVEEIKAADK